MLCCMLHHVMPNSHGSPHTTRRSCLCRVGRCELSWPDRLHSVRPMRSASECVQRSHCAARHTPTLNAVQTITPDTTQTVLSVSCLVCWCELDDCCERVQTSSFLSATVPSCRGNPVRTAEADATRTRQFSRVWRVGVN